jgi:hypothetical protein
VIPELRGAALEDWSHDKVTLGVDGGGGWPLCENGHPVVDFLIKANLI